jgi:peptide deformylase
MSIRSIVITGEPVLHQRAVEVEQWNDELKQLVEDMFETMDEAPGVGLAAPQVGVGLRIFTYDYPDDSGNERRGVLINPVLVLGPVSDELPDEDTESEGCLSVPGERFPLKRAETIRITGLDLEQKPVSIEASGWYARIFQHEFDHLEGKLYVDRLIEPYSSMAREAIEEFGWGVPGCSWLPGHDDIDA